MNTNGTNAKIINHIFYLFFFLILVAVVVILYTKIIVQNNYQIIAEVSCDTTIEKCFVRICDPSNDDTCPESSENRVSYYKIISKKAANIVLCESTVSKIDCDGELRCTPGEESCSYRTCNPAELLQDEECSE